MHALPIPDVTRTKNMNGKLNHGQGRSSSEHIRLVVVETDLN